MAEAQLAAVLHHLRQLSGAAARDGLTDGQLLQRFAAGREESAFAALLERHGRLVWGVCRHVLRHEQDAEDAFQATFIVLARKAASIRKSESVASWLHGVAYRVSLKARSRAAARQARERPAEREAPPGPPAEAALRELQAILDEEVGRLPAKLRAPFVLCCLEGRSKGEAARELGWKEGTVSGRLAQARERLRARLARRGVALSAGLTAAALAHGAASAAVPAALGRTAVAAVMGRAAADGAAALAKGVLRVMFLNKLKASAGVVLLLVVCAAGTGLAARGSGEAPPAPPEVKAAPPEVKAAPAEPPATRFAAAPNAPPAEAPPTPLAAAPNAPPAEAPTAPNAPLAEAPAAPNAPAEAPAAPPRLDLQGDPLPPGALVRLGTTRLRHSGLVTAVAFSPDGKLLASAGDDELIRLWEPASGKALGALPGHAGAVRCLAFSPDGKTLASGGRDKLICLWDVAAVGKPGTKPTQARGHEDIVMSLAFGRDGKALYSGGWDGTIGVWDPATGKELRRFDPGEGKVRSIALAADGKLLASANLTGNVPFKCTVHLWDPASGKHLRQLGPELKEISGVAFSPDGDTLAVAEQDRLRLFEVANGEELHKGRKLGDGAYCVGFAPDGKTVIAGSSGRLRRWALSTGRELTPFEGDQNFFYSLAFTADGKTVACGGTRTVGVWDAAAGKERHRLTGHPGEVNALFFSPDGQELLTCGYGTTLRQWDVTTGKEVRTLQGARVWNNNTVLSPDGKTVAVQGENMVFRLLDLATGKELRTIEGHKPPKGTYAYTGMWFAFAPDGKTLASAATGRLDATIRLWDVGSGKELKRLAGPDNGPSFLAFSPDGKTVASATWDGMLSFWDVASGKERRYPLPARARPYLAFAPDGRLLALGAGLSVSLWDVALGRKVRDWALAQGEVVQLAFSPDGRTLAATGEKDGRARLFEVATGKPRLAVGGHLGAVKGVAFSPDGRLLATGGEDTTALLWDARTLPLLGRPAVAEPSPKQLDELWAEVSGADAEAAYRAAALLARAPKLAVPFVKERVVRIEPKRLDKLIAQLDDDDFATREKATAELIALGRAAEGPVRKAMAGGSAETRLRAETILTQIEKGEGEDARRLGGLRGLEVLEMIGTPEARRVVEDVSKGDPEAELTREAKAALGRMTKKDEKP